TGYAPGAELAIHLESDPVLLANVTADVAGGFTALVEIPAGPTLGAPEIVVTGGGADGEPLEQRADLTVVDGETPGTVDDDTATDTKPSSGTTGGGSGQLARTGSDAPKLILVGSALILGGAVLLRRRRTATA